MVCQVADLNLSITVLLRIQFPDGKRKLEGFTGASAKRRLHILTWPKPIDSTVMKRLVLLIILLLPMLSYGQKLPVVRGDDNDDIYVTRKESGELILFFQIYDWNHSGYELLEE